MFFPFELRWQDIVDILLISYVLFRLYVVFRGTNAFRVFLGIMGLLLLQRIAVSVGLILTSWAVQGITAVAALIVVVVFRNEIRAALQARNLKTFFWGSPGPLSHTPHICIAEAAFALAEKKIGGLIVLPGGSDVYLEIHSSIRTDCRLSREMLMSVFWPDNPVHDGAVIVRGDRIEDVAAVLPLSQRNDLPSHYGLRHRAAAGIAGAADVIAIVISEERGTVSAFYGDTVLTFTDASALLRYLEHHRPIAAALEDNRRKALSMAVAGAVSLLFITSVWFSFARRDGTLVSMEVPLEYVRRDTNFDYVDADIDTVRLQLSGATALLKNLSPAQLKARVELRTGVIGENVFRLNPDNFSLPPGVVLRRVTPESVNVTLDSNTLRKVPVQVDWTGTLPAGMRIESCEVVPEYVQITGPGMQLEQLTTVYTFPIDVAELQSISLKDVPLVIPPEVRKIEPNKVTVKYTLPQAGE
jgi:diadenylate cyclase